MHWLVRSSGFSKAQGLRETGSRLPDEHFFPLVITGVGEDAGGPPEGRRIMPPAHVHHRVYELGGEATDGGVGRLQGLAEDGQ